MTEDYTHSSLWNWTFKILYLHYHGARVSTKRFFPPKERKAIPNLPVKKFDFFLTDLERKNGRTIILIGMQKGLLSPWLKKLLYSEIIFCQPRERNAGEICVFFVVESSDMERVTANIHSQIASPVIYKGGQTFNFAPQKPKYMWSQKNISMWVGSHEKNGTNSL